MNNKREKKCVVLCASPILFCCVFVLFLVFINSNVFGQEIISAGIAVSSTDDFANPESDPNNLYWDDSYGIPGTDASVWSSVVDGLGNLYIGGEFGTTGGVSTNKIAKWDGSTWTALGSGIDYMYHTPRVSSMVVNGSDLYVGGFFSSAGGVGASFIARWDGSSWSALGDGISGLYPYTHVYALAVDGGDLYVGGEFDTAGSVSADYIAKWDGSSWSSLNSQMNSTVHAIVVIGSDIYAGGGFTTAGGVGANKIAKWDGSTWTALGTGLGGAYPIVYSLAESGGDLYVGGYFTTAGGVSVNNIAKWDGTTWSALGTGLDGGEVRTLVASGNNVFAGGSFMMAGGVTANKIAKWDGTAWSVLGTGMDSNIYTLALNDNTLVAGGEFSTAGDKPSNYIAMWQPRINVDTVSFTASPGDTTLGDDTYGFYKPALTTDTGTTVSYGGGLPVDVTMERADEIEVNGQRVNCAFSLTPSGVVFGGTGATLRIEFSEDDVAAYGGAYAYTDFRAARLTYPLDYPTNMEAAGVDILSNNTATPIRVENGRQIYAITIPFTEINSTYGAVPLAMPVSDWSLF